MDVLALGSYSKVSYRLILEYPLNLSSSHRPIANFPRGTLPSMTRCVVVIHIRVVRTGSVGCSQSISYVSLIKKIMRKYV